MNWISGITITCFAASYAVSLALEVSRLFFRAGIRMAGVLGFAAAGLLAHSLYLIAQAQSEIAGRVIPWSSWYDFCLLAALVLAGAYLGLTIRRPDNALGIFLLPLVLALIGLAFLFRDEAPFAAQEAVLTWRSIHGITLLIGTVAVTLGFATGVMYLVQSYRLKHKLPPRPGFRLPTLEWLQRFNRETLLISTCLLAIGLVSGVVLNLSQRAGSGSGVEWTDPVVLSSGVLFTWLLAITLFESFYRPARQGKKVAYLTLASFVFLGLALFFVLFSQHATQAARAVGSRDLWQNQIAEREVREHSHREPDFKTGTLLVGRSFDAHSMGRASLLPSRMTGPIHLSGSFALFATCCESICCAGGGR